MDDVGVDATASEGDINSRFRLWLLLTGNRNVLAGLLTIGLFAALVVGGMVNVTPLRAVVRAGTHVERLFQAFVGSLITGITIVVTLNQIVLSRELGPLDDQRDRMSGAISFREDLEELAGSVMPPDPASFLGVFMTLSEDRAEHLRDITRDNANDDLREDTEALTNRIRTRAAEIDDQLSDVEFGRFELLSAVLNYNYSWNTYALRRIRSEYAASLTDDERAAFDDLVEVLQLFGPAREHFKTLHFRWELVNFSRGILYTGVPALALSILGLLYIDPNSFPGSTAGVDNIVVIISAVAALATAPFFLLTAYIVRLGTIAQRTLAIGPFVLHESDRYDEFEPGGDR